MNELEQIVQSMLDSGQPEENINAVIAEYESRQSGKTNAVAEETATVAADQQSGLDLQSESGLSEPQEIPEVPTWLEETFGQDTFGVDFVSDMYRAVKNGWRQSSAAGEIADVFTGDQSDEALNNMREKMQYIQETAQSEEMQSFQKAVEEYKEEGDNGFMAGLKAFLENPTIGPEVMLSSVTQLAGTALEGGAVSGLVAAGAGTGAGVGAAATAYGLGVGAIPGAVAGAQGASMMAMETLGTYSELLKEKIEEKGGSFSNNQDIRNVLDSTEDMADIKRKALGRGIAIGAIEALTGGIAGKIGSGAKGLIGLQKTARLAGSLAVETAGGMAGETVGMLAAGQELKGEDILLEGIAGGPTAVAQTALQLAGKGDPQYVVSGKKIKAREGKATIKDMVENASDEDFAGMRVKIKNDPKLEEEVQERRKKIIKSNKEAVKQKIQPEKATDLKRKIDFEIKKTKAEVEQIRKTDGDVVAEAAEKRLKALEQQLNDVDNHINYQLDELSEEETLNLMNMDDEVSMYQSVLNDPSSSEAAKKSAKGELLRLKNSQVEALNNTDSADLVNPDGPTKQKNIDLSKKTQEAYEKGDTDGIIKAQGGMISSVATSLWSRIPADKQVGTYDGFKAALISSKGGLLDLIRTYEPETGVPLAAWIGNKRTGLKVRANRIVKELTKQDIEVSTDSTEALNSFSNNEIDVDNINLGPKYNSQRLGLGVNLLDEAASNVELGTVAIEKALAESDTKAEAKSKPLSQKQRQTVSEKAFNKFFKDQYAKRVKDKIGKKLDQKEYIKNNTKALKEIVIANTNFAMGKGLTKDWNKYPPSDQAFQDFYEGTDTDNSQTISDRKAALAEAVSAQIGKDAKDNYFEGKEAERAKIGEDLGISYQRDEEIQEQVDEIYNTPGHNIFMKDQEMIRNSDEVNSYNKAWKKIASDNEIERLDRADSEFRKKFRENFMIPHANKFAKNLWVPSIVGFYESSSNKNDSAIFGNKEGVEYQIEGIEFDNSIPLLPSRFVFTKDKKLKTFGSGSKKMNLRDYVKTDEFKNNEAKKLPALKQIFLTIENILQDDKDALPYILELLADSAKNQGHFMRFLAPFKFFTTNFDALVVEEHSLPQIIVTKFLLFSALEGKVNENFKYIEQNYFQGALERIHDDMLAGEFEGKKFNFKQKLLDGQMWDDSTWARYFNKLVESQGGIPPFGYELTNGNTIAQEFNVTSSGVLASLEMQEQTKSKVENKIQSAIQKQEDLNSDPELTDSEKAEALSDLMSSVYGVQVTSDKQAAIDYLVERGRSKKDAAKDVEARGFKTSDFIYINPSKAGVDTAMHEFTHLWADLVYAKDPELFNAIFEKLKSHPRYQEAVNRMSKGDYAKLIPGSYEYNNEIMAHILGEEGKSLYELFEGDAEAKTLIDKFFDYIKEALGFDPATKNFADLTVDEVIKLAVKDISEGNPAANFDKLKNVAEGKSWYAKTEATQNPSAKAKADPMLRALNKLKLSYRKNKNLAQAINDAYSEVEGTMDFLDFAKLIAKNTKEITTGKTKQLLVGKASFIKAEKIAEESAKKNEESKIKEEEGVKLANKLRNLIYGKPGKPSKWFIPPNAEDFKGLLYTFLPGGEKGVEAKKWLTETLIKPYSDAIAALDTEIQNKSTAWKQMSKGFDFTQKVKGSPYTLGDAIKVYNGLQNGQDPNIAKKKHLDALIHAVESDSKVLNFANEVNELFPIDVKSGWQNKSFAKEIFDSINDGARKRHLTTFSENVDSMFTGATLDLIADQYGNKYKQALVNTLARMKSGRNRVSTDASANSYMNWINRAVGTTMFLNTRSAFLQTLSSLNFINKPNNNLFQATKAFANQAQWKKDYNTLWNSDYLLNRRDGAKFDVLADEMSTGDVKGIEKLLKAGFLPTRYADSFAIALGGAAFYRNRINALVKSGMDVKAAEEQAMVDWREAAEESQQSSDPSKISEIQASSVGKLIYAFANTPFQYARITKRKLQDLTSGRSAAEGNVQKDIQSLLYYSVGQSIMFNALQGGLAALAMSDNPEDDELKDEKYVQIIERTLTSFAKSIGNPGAVASTLYAMLKEGYMQQTGERRKDANVFALTATSISPPVNSKLKDLSAAYRAFNKIDEKDLLTPSLDSEALTMAGEVSSFVGLPLDRVVKKARHLAAITNEEVELWQKVWMLAGWSEWELGVNKRDVGVKKPKIKKAKITKAKITKSKIQKSPNKKLENGVAGRANNDGTIEIDPNLSPVEREITIAHEKQHMKDMDSGKLNYDDNYVYWNGGKYERKDGKIKYKGKSYIEGHKDLPWEKVAYAAEPSKSAVKRKLYE